MMISWYTMQELIRTKWGFTRFESAHATLFYNRNFRQWELHYHGYTMASTRLSKLLVFIDAAARELRLEGWKVS